MRQNCPSTGGLVSPTRGNTSNWADFKQSDPNTSKGSSWLVF
jgi:hypothetical protein